MTSWSWSGQHVYLTENRTTIWWAIKCRLQFPFPRTGTSVRKIKRLFSEFIRDKQSAERAKGLQGWFLNRFRVYLSVFSRSSFFVPGSTYTQADFLPRCSVCFVTAGRELSGICKNSTVVFCEVLTKVGSLYISPHHYNRKTEKTIWLGKAWCVHKPQSKT